jgi:hypothetical protein
VPGFPYREGPTEEMTPITLGAHPGEWPRPRRDQSCAHLGDLAPWDTLMELDRSRSLTLKGSGPDLAPPRRRILAKSCAGSLPRRP